MAMFCGSIPSSDTFLFLLLSLATVLELHVHQQVAAESNATTLISRKPGNFITGDGTRTDDHPPPEMRVSEVDTNGTLQCGHFGKLRFENYNAVCRQRTRCSLDNIIHPIRLCRVSTRPVFGRTLDGSVFSRSGPEGICCQIKGVIRGTDSTENDIIAPKSKTLLHLISPPLPPALISSSALFQTAGFVRDRELDVIPYYSMIDPSLLTNSITEFASTKGELRPFLHKSFTAMNIGDLGLDCGRRNLSYKMMRLGRIVGGVTAGFSDWPWVVMVMNYGRPRCGGTLLSNMTVVTAAHCVSGNKLLYNLTVRIGMFNTNERDTLPFPPVQIAVQQIIRHPEFDLTTLLNDVAILQLTHPVTFAPNIMPVCLASQEYPANTPTIILGWGKEDENSTVYQLPDSLQAVSVPIFNRQECAQYFAKQGLVDLISVQHICAGSDEGGRDACQGDSGGPMVIANPDGRFELLGIISWGFGCGAPHIPAVYTNIYFYKEWIISTVKQLYAAV